MLASCIDENPAFEPTDSSYVFDINALPDVHLAISEDEWNKLLNYFDQNPYNEE